LSPVKVLAAAAKPADAKPVDASKVVKPVEKKAHYGADEVIEFVLKNYTLGTSTDGLLFVTPSDPKAPKVAREIKSLRSEISRAIWDLDGVAVNREVIATAIATLCGLAERAPVSSVFLRAARVGTALNIDLGDSPGRYVEISPYGWELRDPREETDADAARAIFRRTPATSALPTPEKGGSRDDLRELLGFTEDDPRWLLVWGWLVAAAFQDVPRPILWALGAQGSGKSTRARMVLNVLDPVNALGREPGKNEKDDSVSAAARLLPSWDNVGTVSAATSDWLCRIVTGVEISRRALYSDDDVRVSTLRRSGVATSIVLPFGLGADALERLVLVELERVAETDRRAESDLWSEFNRLHGRILGALLDDIAGVLEHLPAARAEATELPRMADYALILAALDRHADLDDVAGFADVYKRSVRSVLADRAQSDPLTTALLVLAGKSTGKSWSGPAELLLRAIESGRPDDPRTAWPTSGASLSAALTRGQESLRAAGLIVGRVKTNGVRRINLQLIDVGDTYDDDCAAVPAESRPAVTARIARSTPAVASVDASALSLSGADFADVI
jgi:hypothetical protein